MDTTSSEVVILEHSVFIVKGSIFIHDSSALVLHGGVIEGSVVNDGTLVVYAGSNIVRGIVFFLIFFFLHHFSLFRCFFSSFPFLYLF